MNDKDDVKLIIDISLSELVVLYDSLSRYLSIASDEECLIINGLNEKVLKLLRNAMKYKGLLKEDD